MNKTLDQLEALSPEKRALLALKAKKQKLKAAAQQSAMRKQPRGEGSQTFPLSTAQQSVMFYEEFMPNTYRYHFTIAFRLLGKLRIDALQRALNAIVDRHEVLRALIAYEDDDYVQHIQPERKVELEIIELDDPSRLHEQMYVTAPYDFKNGPLVRARLVKVSPEEHALVWMTHHLMFDGESINIFVEEMSAYYRSYVQNVPVHLPELSVQYPDYAVWQRQWMNSDSYAKQMDFWLDKLRSPLPKLDLPTDYPRSTSRTGNEKQVACMMVEPSVSARLKETSKQLGCTFYSLMLAVYKLMLSSYSGQQEVLVGTPMANRRMQEVERLIGFFANTVVIRSRVDLQSRFRDFAAQVWDNVLEANDHQDIPFDRIVEALNPERSNGHAVLFDTMFLYEPPKQPGVALPGLKLEAFPAGKIRGGELDLTLTVFEQQDGSMELAMTYSSDLFKEATVNRLVHHYRTMLERVADNADGFLYEVAAVPQEQFEVMTGWNRMNDDTPSVELPHLLLERQAALTPDSAAVCSEGKQLSYRELNQRANSLAHYLRSRGVGPNQTVGLYMERTTDIMVGLLGILKAGGVYVPLDAKLPGERIRTVMEEADVSVLVTETLLRSQVPASVSEQQEVIVMDRDWPLIALEGTDNPEVLSRPTDLMYLLFTSGSTGKPKGVAVEHRNYANYLQGIMDRMQLEPGLHYAIVSTLAADLGTPMIWGAFATGGTLHVIPYERAADPDAFADYCREHPIDVMKIVPSHFEALMSTTEPAVIIPRRCLAFAGEASHWGTVQEVRRLRPDCEIQNHYGPTETTVSVLAYPVPNEDDVEQQATLPLGYPIPNAPVYVLNACMQPVPIGAAGELYIGGRAVTRGYFGRTDLTAERFLPDPFASEPGSRMYRTGDLVRYRPDGTLQFIGRTDYQVKIRGYRIETGEIEHSLLGLDGIRDAVVIAREDEPGDKRLVAYLVPDLSGNAVPQEQEEQKLQLDVSVIRHYLKDRLPDYMIPSAFVELEKLPLNANGKLDRAALPKPEMNQAAGDDLVAPRTKLEQDIADVWCEVIGMKQVGIDQEFFDLGGDSFKAIKVVRKMGNTFSVMDLFQYPTIRQLAEHLTSGAAKSDDILIPFKKSSAISGPVKTMVCVPYGGGSAITFQPLARELPDNFNLLAVELPGHDFSRPDQPLASLDAVAARCAEEIKEKAEGDLYLYGHCLGGAMILRIGMLLEQANVQVKGVFMAGTFPTARLPFRIMEWWHKLFPREKWTSDKFARDMLRAFGGFDDEVSPEEEKFILRNMRHDAREAEDFYTALYRMEERPKLQAPIACIVGEADRMTEFYEERHLEWKDFCEEVNLHVVDNAGHYFHKHQTDYLSRILSNQIDAWENGEVVEEVAATSETAIHADIPPISSLDELKVKPSVKAFLMVTMCLIIATIGTSITGFALGIWVFQQTGSISNYATISLFAIIPTILLLPVAGAVVDRYDRRKVMLAGQCLALISVLFLATLLYFDALTIWAIYVGACMGSIAGAFINPAYLAATAQLVPKRYLGNANGLGQMVFSINGIMAPALGGALIVMIGVKRMILIDIVTLIISILILSLIRFPNLMFRKQEEPMIKEIIGGWKYIINRKSMVAMVVFFVVANFFMSLYNVLTTPYLLQFLNPEHVGLVVGIEGAGLLIGSIIMSIWGGFDRRTDGMVGAVILTGLSIVMAGIYPSLVTAVIGLFGFGLALAIINTHWLAIIQTKVGLELQGRVVATNQVMVFSMRPLSFLVAGPLVAVVFTPLFASMPDAFLPFGMFGNGSESGIAMLLVTIGAILVLWGVLGLRYRPLRDMENIMPDAIPDSIIIKDKDKLQQLADSKIGASKL